MAWFYLTLLSVVIVSFSSIFQRILMKDDKSNPRSYAVVFHFLVTIFYFIFAFAHGFWLPQLSARYIFFITASILWGLGTIFLFKALKLLEASEVTIITSTRTIITIAVAVIFLKEVFDVQKIIGTIIIFISIFLATNLKKGIKFNRGVLYSFGMALCYGLGLSLDAFIIKDFDPISYLAVGNLMIGTFLLLLYPRTVKEWRVYIKPVFLKKMLPLGLLSSTQAIAYYFALKFGAASQIASINLSQVILTVLLAVIVLKERDNLMRKLVAAVLVTIGVFLLR